MELTYINPSSVLLWQPAVLLLFDTYCSYRRNGEGGCDQQILPSLLSFLVFHLMAPTSKRFIYLFDAQGNNNQHCFSEKMLSFAG
jgi:hypothetical protein